MASYIVIVIVVLVLFFVERYFAGIPFAEAQVLTLTNLQEKALETFVEMNRLLTTLATVTIGALAAFASYRYTAGGLPRDQVIRAIVGSTFAGISLYLGYATYGKVVWMLHAGFFNLFAPQVLWPSKLQFYTFLVSVALLGAFAYRGLQKQ